MAQLIKVVKWIFLGLLLVGAAFAGLERLAAERIEVVELIAADEAGDMQITRLWVADDEGMAYLMKAWPICASGPTARVGMIEFY